MIRNGMLFTQPEAWACNAENLDTLLVNQRTSFVIHRKYLAHSLCEKVFISYDPHSQNKVNS